MKKFLTTFLLLLGITVLRVPHALAEFNSTPDTLPFEVDPSATGWSVMATGTGAYFNINGFPSDIVGTSTKPIIHSAGGLFSVANGTGSSTYAIAGPDQSDIAKAISDGSGGFYIIGTFTTMNGVSRTGLAHVLANNTVDPNFNPAITGGSNFLGQGNEALSPDGSVLYVSSPFLTAVNSQSRDNIAAIKTSDGSVVAGFNPTGSGNGFTAHLAVLGVSPDGSKIYVVSGGGATINGVAHGALAELASTTGATIAGFDPAPNGTINAAVPNSTGTTLYVSGSFTSIGGISRTNVAALNISDGTGVSAFNSTPNGTVTSILLSSDNSTLYATGGFTTIGGHSHTHIAALKTADGTDVTAFSATMVGNGNALALTPDGTKLFAAGGSFGSAAFNTSDGSALASWPMGLAAYNARYTGIAMASDGLHFFAGGTAEYNGGFIPSSPLKLSTVDDSIDPSFNVTVDNVENNLFSVLSPDGTIMYLGGLFSTINGVAHVGLAAVHTSDGSLVAGFNPILNDPEVDDLVITKDGSTLYIGGFFTQVDGQPQKYLAAVRTSDGSLITSFAPVIDSTAYRFELSPDESKLYIAGFFSKIGADTRTNGLGAVNTSDGSDVTAFNPDPDNTVQDILLSKDGSKLYIGGFFNNLGVTPRNFLGVANTSDGSIRSDFDPEPDDIVNGLTLYPDGTGNTIWVAGSFSHIGGQPRDAVASLNATDGSVNAFSQTTLLAGGWFTAFSGDLSKMYLGSEDLGPALFIFTDPTKLGGGTVVPTVTTQVASGITDVAATLNGNITATGGANPTTRGFVYGTTVLYGATTTENGSFSTGAYTGNVSSLTCNTTYHFKAYATNTSGSGYSADNTFTTAACSGGGGSNGSGGGGIVLSGQGGHSSETLILTASSTTIAPGKSSTLTWSSTNTTSCNASGGWTGAQKLSGSKNVSPATTTVYTLTCSGLFGSVAQSATVTVVQPQVTLTLTASSSSIIIGKSSTLKWTSTKATSCIASGGWSGTQNLSGSKSVSPTTTTTYILTCTGAGGTATQSATVTVTVPPPVITFTTASTTLTLGKSTTIKWSTTNAATCVASGGVTGSENTSGSLTVTPTTTTTYTLTCTGAGGTSVQNVTVNIYVPPPTLNLTASSTQIVLGKTSTLKWSSSNVTACTASNGWTGTQNTSGSKSVKPAITTIYTLECTGAGGTVTQSATVTVCKTLATCPVTSPPAPTQATTTTPTTSPVVLITTPTSPTSPSIPNPITSPVEFVTAVVAVLSALGGSIVGKVLAVAEATTSVLPGALAILPAIIPLLPQLITLTTDAVEVATTLPLPSVPEGVPEALPIVADFAGAISLSDGIEGFVSQMVDYILSLFGFHRRKNHLGVMFDSLTGEPIRHGYVTLHNATTGERVAVSVTDLAGAYGFFIKPGSYVIRAAHSGFSFPSINKNLNLSFAAIYDNVYHGEVIEVTNEAEVVGRNIAMDRTSSYKPEGPVYLHRGLRQIYNVLGSLIFALGFISSLHAAWVLPNPKTIIVLAVYILVTAWSLLHRREWGRIYDRKTGKLLSGFLLELTTTENKIIDRTVTDHSGRFLIHASRGNYLLKVYEFGRTEPLAIKNILIGKEGVVNNDMGV